MVRKLVTAPSRMQHQEKPGDTWEGPRLLCFQSVRLGFVCVLLVCGLGLPAIAAERIIPASISSIQRVTIPILGTTINRHWEQVGVVAEVQIQFERRQDHKGLQVFFRQSPGRFSQTAQQAVHQAINQVIKVSHLDAGSWSVTLTLPYQGLTMYGESLSGMVGLSVLALAKGDPLPQGRVLTGTITSTGQIGVVGGVPLKIEAAHEMHLHKVLIPEEIDVADGDWNTPFLMHVSPVGTIQQAYRALTGRSLETPPVTPSLSTLAAK